MALSFDLHVKYPCNIGGQFGKVNTLGERKISLGKLQVITQSFVTIGTKEQTE